MTFLDAIILGIVEGLTEYLPVSSTAHLLIAQRLLGIEQTDQSNAFAIVIQAGAILAVLGVYRIRVRDMIMGFLGKNPEGLKLAINLIVAFLPAAVFGLLFDDKIEELLFGPWPIVIAWTVGAIVILATGKWQAKREGFGIESMTWKHALMIGFIQCLAMWPGTSRSLATIMGGLLAGLSLVAAVEFSFLLGVITLGAATAYKTLQHGPTMLTAYGPEALIVGVMASWFSAVLAVRWMVTWLSKHGLGVFAWWRLAAALVVVVMILTGSM